MINKIDEYKQAHDDKYTQDHASIMFAISYSVCDEGGELLFPGNIDAFKNVPAWARFPIADELRLLNKNEEPAQGKDSPKAPEQ